MNFYCFVDVSTDKAIIIKTNKSKNNYKNTFNLNVTKNYVYHFKFESYIVWSYLIYVRTRPHYKLNPMLRICFNDESFYLITRLCV